MTTTKLPAAFSPEVLAALARPFTRVDPRAAELSPGRQAKWYVVEVRSRDVEAELIKRQFGIYVPECEETAISRGRKISRRIAMFPGYVFVFLWETDANWGRLCAVDGVAAVMGTLSDEEIDKIRAHENTKRPIVLQWFEVRPELGKKIRRRWRKRAKIPMEQDEIVVVRSWSAFEDAIDHLDSEGRNQSLRSYISS
ncbi:transcription termination/antitermination protein NusG [Bradyrhizobium liaoningense]